MKRYSTHSIIKNKDGDWSFNVYGDSLETAEGSITKLCEECDFLESMVITGEILYSAPNNYEDEEGVGYQDLIDYAHAKHKFIDFSFISSSRLVSLLCHMEIVESYDDCSIIKNTLDSRENPPVLSKNNLELLSTIFDVYGVNVIMSEDLYSTWTSKHNKDFGLMII